MNKSWQILIFTLSLSLCLTFASRAEELLLHWEFDRSTDLFEEDSTGHGHNAKLIRGDFRLPYPERVADGVHGAAAGAVRLLNQSKVVSARPLPLPESWTLSFWINDERPDGQLPEAISPADLLTIEKQWIGLDQPWFFQADPGNIGVRDNWFAEVEDRGWPQIEVPAFWSETHVGGSYYGYGWYQTRFQVLPEAAGLEHELYFGGVDEQAWVYINGQLVGEQSVESTGQDPGAIWDKPFSVRVGPENLRVGDDNLLVVRVHASAGQAGIFRPVNFLRPEEEKSEVDFSSLLATRATPGDWEHFALTVDPEGARLFVNGELASRVEQPLAEWLTGPVQLAFVQRGDNHFTGLLDDVRLYAGVVPEQELARLSGNLYHPEADWLVEYNQAMRRLIHAGRLSRSATSALIELGAPDSTALLETLESSQEAGDQLDALWALGVLGDYTGAVRLIEEIDSSDASKAAAAVDALLAMHDEGLYPARFQEHDDSSAAISWLTRVLQGSGEPTLQMATLEGLQELAGPAAGLAALIEQVDSERAGVAEAALGNLLRLYEDGVYPALLIGRDDAEAVGLIGKVLVHAVDRNLQFASLRALGEIDREEAYQALATAVEEGSWVVRRYAAEMLHEQGRPTDLNLVDELRGWPMWGYDPARSLEAPHQLAEPLHLQWVRRLPAPSRAWEHQWDDRGKLDFDLSYTPVATGSLIFVPSNLTDSVTAYRVDDGSEVWRFYTDGPVRLAPAVSQGRIFFTSDDGHLYCLEAATGELLWQFQGGPTDQRFLGNRRIINFWAARGAPVVVDDKVYFAAGIWPLHGIFIYALEAATGEIVWVNDTTSSDYVSLPHGGAEGYGGLVPQGYLAAAGDRLVVAGGRATPAFLDRHSGQFLHADFRSSKGAGGYAVHAIGEGGYGMRRNQVLEARLDSVEELIEGEVFTWLATRDYLFVTTIDGALYCFGSDSVDPVSHDYNPVPMEPRTGQWRAIAEQLLERLGEDAGYALMLGAGSGDLLRELLLRSELHVVVAEKDGERVQELREELVGAGLYGRRAAVVKADPASFQVQPYLFSLVVSEDSDNAGFGHDTEVLARVLDRLRPYGGLAWLGRTTVSPAAMEQALTAARIDQVELEVDDSALFADRGGPLSGAGQWTHQHHDPANTLLSHDERVRLPLGVLWFGGPGNHNILPRHSGGPRPQVAAGRQVFLGVENMAARCVYTGRALWDRSFPGIGHPFTNLELEQRWAAGSQVYMTNIPGATYIGSPFVTLPDSVYLRYQGAIHRLDPATGNDLQVFSLPGRSVAELYDDDSLPDWGHLSVRGDYLVTTSEPHIFEDQRLGWTNSYSGTSSRHIAVLDRFSGEVRWQRQAKIGFRHNAIISSQDTLYLIDGLSENAINHLARRGEVPNHNSVVMALDLRTGEERWRSQSQVFGTFLIYSEEHDILLEGGEPGFAPPPWR